MRVRGLSRTSCHCEALGRRLATPARSIHSRLEHGPHSVEIRMDAAAMRLLEIGEAVKALSPQITATEPGIKWRDIAGMRDFLAHHYFDTTPEVVQAVIDKDLAPLHEAVVRMLVASSPTEHP